MPQTGLAGNFLMHFVVQAIVYAGEQSGFIAECVNLPVVTEARYSVESLPLASQKARSSASVLNLGSGLICLLMDAPFLPVHVARRDHAE
jgi:hypothetical protein